MPPSSQVLERVGGRDMTFIRVDHQTRLQFGEFEVVIEGPFRVTAPDGSEHNLDPGVRASLGPVLALYPDALITATVDAKPAYPPVGLTFSGEVVVRQRSQA